MARIAAEEMSRLSLHSPTLKGRSFPEFIYERAELFQRLKAEYDDWLRAQPRDPIRVSLPDGKVLDGKRWETTPMSVAEKISKGLADKAVIAKVDGELWDLERPLEGSCCMEILDFDSDQGKQVFWHSSAHIMGEAMESHYEGCLCYGPPIDEGFYYDMYMGNKIVSTNDFPQLEEICKDVVMDKQPFVRLEVTIDNLKEMFKYNEFKLRIIENKITTPKTTVYKCGPLIDLCRGPHIPHTGKVKALSIQKTSSTYWEGKTDKESLQRVYGISFPDKKRLKEWKHIQEEAAKRDHRRIGRQDELFFFSELSPGSCFFLPRGASIYNRLVDFIKEEYHKRDFTEVITPNIYNTKLWETSGHWQNYAENMFSFEVDKEKYAMKPMNCPGHCIMFSVRNRSWKELPIRFADFGVLHRNELSGALTGLTRVRRFCQDDAHIFCAVSQLETEIEGCLSFIKYVYDILGFPMKLNLSTRPDKFMGDIAVWDKAEKELENALNKNGLEWTLNPKDGAFYGPKIDIQIQDALRRFHQCATIQLDFQLPERFKLQFVTKNGDHERPVIIHRAILGSIERMMAILTENYAGKWPFWLSPNQIAVVPVSPTYYEYAEKVRKELYSHKFYVEVYNNPSDVLRKNIRNAQLAHFNFILVVGEEEKNSDSVNVRTRSNEQLGMKSLNEFIEIIDGFRKNRTKDVDLKFE